MATKISFSEKVKISAGGRKTLVFAREERETKEEIDIYIVEEEDYKTVTHELFTISVCELDDFIGTINNLLNG